MEPGTGLTILGTAIGSAKLLEKLLGPTAEYIGGEIKNYAEKGVENLRRIFTNAAQKLGNRLEEPGQVPPKVLKGILEEGYFCEDELTGQYFGGVLASSRSGVSRDDRGATHIKLLSSLSTYQIRTHYILYTLLRKTLFDFRKAINPGTNRDIMYIYIPTDIYYSAMDIDSEFSSSDEKLSIQAHSMNGMKRLNLVEDFIYGEKDIFLQENIMYRFLEYPINEQKLSEHGLSFQPTPGGMELYLWAHGFGHIPHQQFLNDKLIFEPIPDINLPESATILYEQLLKNMLNLVAKE